MPEEEKFEKCWDTAREEVIGYYDEDELEEMVENYECFGALHSEDFYEYYPEEIDAECERCYGKNWKQHTESKLSRAYTFIQSVALDSLIPEEDNQGEQGDLNKADMLYEVAQQAYNGADHVVAINLLTQAIKLNPSDGWFYYERGQAKDELEDFNGAVEDFTQALSFDPDEDLLGNCLHARANTRFFGLNDKKGACEDWSKAAAMGRENSAEYLRAHCQ